MTEITENIIRVGSRKSEVSLIIQIEIFSIQIEFRG